MTYRTREFPRLFPNGAYPPNTLLMVDRLVQEPFLVEGPGDRGLIGPAKLRRWWPALQR